MLNNLTMNLRIKEVKTTMGSRNKMKKKISQVNMEGKKANKRKS